MTDLVPYADPRHLELPENLTLEEWTEVGRTLHRAAEGVLWWLGDWWAYGEHRYGDRARVAAEGIGWAFGTCRNAGTVARAFETSRRRDVLSWTHHAEVAALNHVEADELLDLAELEKWSSRGLRSEVRRRATAERLRLAAKRAPELAALGKFQVVYADPPWRYEDAEPSRAVENNYPTMELGEIIDLEVPAAEDAVLFLWAPSPKLGEAITVIDEWGFEHRSAMVWVKDQIGMGYYVRQRHESLLIAKRGSLPVPEPANRPDSVIHAPRTVHSAKPDQFYELIEQMYPGLAYVELFARQSRPGWTSWGNQC